MKFDKSKFIFGGMRILLHKNRMSIKEKARKIKVNIPAVFLH